ncbi:hypothetical protein SAMN05443634_110108 [Chishuiella changwenlii]|uniref:HEAT repeat-containing protein n=1 Tax=Chishuiella changwenlii TaxID=1434701 RepID=A0A1M7BB41_9FLAO|nr:HEAT repeat domain-containing protein [Chishuiella changwenlii]GGE96337.1 hypothetical protein GCM10010984_12320 [Chishuiella changwenlii]SHL52086.1 hypothetical protein SAMN05443634_110108 [Chishuiella changwenlii]
MKDDLKKYIDQNRDDFDIHQPSPELWNRIKNNIPEQPKVIEKQKKWSIGYWSIAASMLLILSIGAYFLFNNQDTVVENEIVKIKSEKSIKKESTIPTESNPVIETTKPIEVVSKSEKTVEKLEQVTPMKDEIIEADKTEIFNLLSDQESTSNRIEALAKLNNASSLNANEIATLKQVALHDNNTNVRLNAIEILSEKLSRTTASDEMTALFLEQDNPMVQMELIGIIAHYNNGETNQKLIKKLQEIVLDPKAMPFVKDEAYAVLLKKENN